MDSPPIENHKGKNYYLYLIQEVIKESHYNSSFLLNMAIRWHCESMIKYLIEGDNEFKPSIDINAKDINGNYPLLTFIRSDRCSHLSLLLYLLEKGADPNVKDSNGYSPLMISIQKEFEMGENIPNSFVQILIEHGASINEKDANGNSLLALAVQKNCNRLVYYFLQNGCPMNEKDASGNYPLMVAISQNQYEIVKQFMRYGKKNYQLKNFCIHDINGNTPLTLAYKLRHDAIFKYLLKYLDINDTDAQGKSLLFHALERNDTKVVKYLVQVGAEVNQEDNLGNSPLIYAIKRGSLSLVQKLVEHGANINVKDRSGTPSLIIAYDYQKMDIFKYLVEHNVTINENFTENEINSIFFRIIIDKNINSLKYIIKNGANVNCFIGSLKSTPLMYACLFNDMTTVKCLVENNANLNIDNTQGNTALAYAISKHNLELVDYLIEHGADIYHKNNENKSIYDIAYENCKHDMIQGEVINVNEKTKIYQKINYLYHE
jgi:ankyrin repeat protein